MKLLELLVQETKRGNFEWPEGVSYVEQYVDLTLFSGSQWSGYRKFERADDYADSKVTRDQYEAALAASEAPTAADEGWIEWHGGKCPVPGHVLVAVKYRNGEKHDDRNADEYDWTHGYGDADTNGADIIAYRLHQSKQDAPAWNGEGLPPVGCECEVRYRHGGTNWGKFKCLAVDKDIAFGWCADAPATFPDDCYEFRPIRTEADKKRETFVNQVMQWMHYAGEAEVALIYDAIARGDIPGIKLSD